jgi:glyoxylase-like metal-dependent hydrolase (beta-lactamase superfamily II)
MISIKTFTFNPIQENTYIVSDETGEAVVIDAGCYFENEKKALQNYLESNNLKLVRVLNTHLHFDHQFGNKFLFDTYGILPEAHKDDLFLLERVVKGGNILGFPMLEDAQKIGNFLEENQEITFGNTTFKIFHVPGHSPGHIVFYCKAEKVLFAGDVLFSGSIGRTDLERGDYATLINNITEKLLILPDDVVVYPGHGPTTSIGEEKVSNPYL